MARIAAGGRRLAHQPRDALRALRQHGSRVGHRLFGLTAPPDDDGPLPHFRPGVAMRMRHGAVAFSLVPVHLETRALV